MVKEMKRQIYLQRTSLPVFLVCSLGVSLIATLGAVALQIISPDSGTLYTIGGVVFVVVAGFTVALGCLSQTGTALDFCLKMGATRRQFVAANLLVNLAFALLLFAAGAAWQYIDRWIVIGFLHRPVQLVGMHPALLLGGGAACCIIGCWAGAILKRYGRRGLAVVGVLWFALTIGGTQFISAAVTDTRTDAFARFAQATWRFLVGLNMPIAVLATLAALFLLILLAHTWGMLRRVQADN